MSSRQVWTHRDKNPTRTKFVTVGLAVCGLLAISLTLFQQNLLPEPKHIFSTILILGAILFFAFLALNSLAQSKSRLFEYRIDQSGISYYGHNEKLKWSEKWQDCRSVTFSCVVGDEGEQEGITIVNSQFDSRYILLESRTLILENKDTFIQAILDYGLTIKSLPEGMVHSHDE